jgi:hypothetical protein
MSTDVMSTMRYDTFCESCTPGHVKINTEPQPSSKAVQLRDMHADVFHNGNWTGQHDAHIYYRAYCDTCNDGEGNALILNDWTDDEDEANRARDMHQDMFHNPKDESPFA